MMAAVGGHTTLDRLLLRRRACALRLLLADDGVDLHLVRHIGVDERRVMGVVVMWRRGCGVVHPRDDGQLDMRLGLATKLTSQANQTSKGE